MKRSKESLKNHLISGFNNKDSQKKVIKTRGSNSLLNKENQLIYIYSNTNFFGFATGWIILSFILWLTLFTSLISLFGLIVFGGLFLFIIKKYFISTENYQIITENKENKNFEVVIFEYKNVLNDDLTLILN
ncbi:hypothetical protein GW796_10630 [archaeon]|nr:hypothetical protein [archaeon]NCQ52317.1 hypothetical protein [archaeon]